MASTGHQEKNFRRRQIQRTIVKWFRRVPFVMLTVVDRIEPHTSDEGSHEGTIDSARLQQIYEDVCGTIAKILPSGALLIAGARNGNIDRFIRQKISNGRSKPMSTHCEEIKDATEPQVTSKNSEKNISKSETKREYTLSLYHKGQNFCFKYMHKEVLQTKDDLFVSAENPSAQNPEDAKGSVPFCYSAMELLIILTGTAPHGNRKGDVKMQIKGGRKLVLRSLERMLCRRKYMRKDDEDVCLPISIRENEEFRSKMLRLSILKLYLQDRFFDFDNSDSSEERKMFKLFINQMYDDEVLTALVEKAVAVEIMEFTFGTDWVGQFLKKTAETLSCHDTVIQNVLTEIDNLSPFLRQLRLKNLSEPRKCEIYLKLGSTEDQEALLSLNTEADTVDEEIKKAENLVSFASDEHLLTVDEEFCDSATSASDEEEFRFDEDESDASNENITDLRDKAESQKYKLLLIWCIKMGLSMDLTAKFWRKGKDKLPMALLAYKVSKQIHSDPAYWTIRTLTCLQMKQYEDFAIEYLWKIYLENPDLTVAFFLTGRIRDLQDYSLVEIALDANCEKFFAQRPCKVLMDCIWKEPFQGIDRFYYSPFAVSLICPFLSPFLLTIDESNELLSEYSLQDSKDRLEFVLSYEERALIYLRKKTSDCENLCNKALHKWCNHIWIIRSFLNAPIVRFAYASVFHVIYLIIFSIVMLTDFRATISNLEIVLHSWTLILATEEIKQIANEGKEYLNRWNAYDDVGLILFLVGFILRIIYYISESICPTCLYTARIVFAFSLMAFILRSMQLLSINATIGPKIRMITGLLKDLTSFMLILAVFIAAYGIGSNIILYPNQPLDIKLLDEIFYNAWWSVLQQFNTEEVTGASCNEDGSNITAEYCMSTTDANIDYAKCKLNKCPANNWVGSVLLGIYALICCIMMLNVLIAMFNDTFSGIESKKKEIYNLERYKLMRENHKKSAIPVPLCAITYWRILPWLIQICCEKCPKKPESGRKRPKWNLFRRNLYPVFRRYLESETVLENDREDSAELEDLIGILGKLQKEDLDVVKKVASSLQQNNAE